MSIQVQKITILPNRPLSFTAYVLGSWVSSEVNSIFYRDFEI
uniref:Uncharacterized protein n=1 Tax=Arundo donax TaxID=35708 RepID=A0A0A8Y616_ARUDO